MKNNNQNVTLNRSIVNQIVVATVSFPRLCHLSNESVISLENISFVLSVSVSIGISVAFLFDQKCAFFYLLEKCRVYVNNCSQTFANILKFGHFCIDIHLKTSHIRELRVFLNFCSILCVLSIKQCFQLFENKHCQFTIDIQSYFVQEISSLYAPSALLDESIVRSLDF